MADIRLGITGQSGFIGSHLFRKAKISGGFIPQEFHRDFFENHDDLKKFADSCDVIVHLAGLSRHEDGEYLYRTNVELTEKLIRACSGSQKILLGSTTHIGKDLPYHASKRKSAELLEQYGNSAILLMANTFGPGSRPFYNSVVSTFCWMAASGRAPERIDDALLQLIYVDDLCSSILMAAKSPECGTIEIPHTHEIRLPELWNKLKTWSEGGKSRITDTFEAELYTTFLSYRTLISLRNLQKGFMPPL